MNSIQRFITAISGGVPDRVPVVPKMWVDLAARLTGTTLYDVILDPYKTLHIMVEAGIDLELDAVRQFHFPQRNIKIEDDIVYEIDKQGTSIGKIDIKGGLITHLFSEDKYNFEDPYTMAHHHFWSSNKTIVKSIEDVKKIAVPDKGFLKQIGWETRQRKIMDIAGEKIALIGDCSSATLAFYVCLRGMSNALFDLLEDPGMVHAAMEKGTAIAVEKGKFNIDMGLKVLRLNDSAANMSLISPAHWREFVKPHMKEVCDELHKYDKDVVIYCHICGNVLPVIEDIMETGIDCIAPLDPLGGFTCAQAREHSGYGVSLMGGVNTLSFVNSTQEEIVNESKDCIEGAGEKGGFILGSGCVVPRDAKKENLIALVNASKKYGVYKNSIL
jgi:uroporphyrinogen-III decarboxylase